MTKCSYCGRTIWPREPSWEEDGKVACQACKDEWERDQDPGISVREAEIEAIVLTTETAPNLPIAQRIEVITAECAFGMNIFKDLFAGVRDIVGGRSEAVQKTMRDARRTVLYELKKEAHEVGANAVVGVDLDYVELSAAGSMVMLVASGTAVRTGE
ncbi:YbjQ family protein [Marivita geojedonensis]|nr:heavy metal-binding domain-containing protein [Marivita geojedonensis]PRY75313.1 uncharacterized protein YbjQ (UPF0145 family) [Marivita geojedonensis]